MAARTLTACTHCDGFRVFMKDEKKNVLLLESKYSDSMFATDYQNEWLESLVPQCKNWLSNMGLDITDCSAKSNLSSFWNSSVCLLFYQDDNNVITVYAQAPENQTWKPSKLDNIIDCLPGTNIGVSVQDSATSTESRGYLCYQSSEGHICYCTINGTYDEADKAWNFSADIKLTLQEFKAMKGTGIAMVNQEGVGEDCTHVFFQSLRSVVEECTIKDCKIIATNSYSESEDTIIGNISAFNSAEDPKDVIRIYLIRGQRIEEYLCQQFTKPKDSVSPSSIYRSRVNKMSRTEIAHMQVVNKATRAAVVFYLDNNLELPLVAVSCKGNYWNSAGLNCSALQDENHVTDGNIESTEKPGDASTPPGVPIAGSGVYTSAKDREPKYVTAVLVHYTAESVNNVVVHYSDQTEASLFNGEDETSDVELMEMEPGEELAVVWIQSDTEKTMLSGIKFATSFARTTKWCGARSKTRVQPQFISKNTFDGRSDNFRESFSWGTFTTCMDVPRIIASLEVVLAEYASSVDTICSVDLSVRASVGVDKAYHLALVERLAGRVEYLQGLEDSRRSAVVAGKDSQSRAEDLTSQARSCRETLEDIWRDFYRWFEVTSGLDLVKENLTSDLIVLEDHILLWKKEALLFMDKQIKELGARVEDANTRLKDASKPHTMPSGSPRFCMCSVKEFDSGVAKKAEEGRDQAYELHSSFDSRFSGLAQGVRSIKDKLDKWEVAKQDVPQQSVLEPPKSYEDVKEPAHFKLAFQEIWKSAKQDRKITESLPSRANSPVEYLLGGSMNEPSAN